jgi:hypothetical protein
MCRSIKVLNRADEPVTHDELNSAALQFVRKISGYHKPSRVNQEVFDRAVGEIAQSSQRLLNELVRAKHAVSSTPPLRQPSDAATGPEPVR